MQILAVATANLTAIEKLQQIPTDFWVKLVLGVFAIFATVVFLRKVAKVNKVVLGVGIFLFAAFAGSNWIYERNEPKWATPVVQWLGGFFPTKGKIEAKGRS
ncbi:MAG: hypothetical protein EXS37_16155 [Opitutus sp.]|nr:hypothetical protein [Opitutus sp.]